MATSAPPAAPAPIADRSTFLVETVRRVAALITSQMIRELADGSMDSSSSLDRAMVRLLTPYMPKLQAALLSRLSAVDGATLELHLSAVAETIAELLERAPGEPGPRMIYRADGQGLVAVPLAAADEPAGSAAGE